MKKISLVVVLVLVTLYCNICSAAESAFVSRIQTIRHKNGQTTFYVDFHQKPTVKQVGDVISAIMETAGFNTLPNEFEMKRNIRGLEITLPGNKSEILNVGHVGELGAMTTYWVSFTPGTNNKNAAKKLVRHLALMIRNRQALIAREPDVTIKVTSRKSKKKDEENILYVYVEFRGGSFDFIK